MATPSATVLFSLPIFMVLAFFSFVVFQTTFRKCGESPPLSLVDSFEIGEVDFYQRGGEMKVDRGTCGSSNMKKHCIVLEKNILQF